MAASLAFKGGISLEQVLSSCYWRSHNTFTNFYLKDICWENDDIFKLGPIVSAQHVVNNWDLIIGSTFIFRMCGVGLDWIKTMILDMIWIWQHNSYRWLEGQLHSDCWSYIQLGATDLWPLHICTDRVMGFIDIMFMYGTTCCFDKWVSTFQLLYYNYFITLSVLVIII